MKLLASLNWVIFLLYFVRSFNEQPKLERNNDKKFPLKGGWKHDNFKHVLVKRYKGRNFCFVLWFSIQVCSEAQAWRDENIRWFETTKMIKNGQFLIIFVHLDDTTTNFTAENNLKSTYIPWFQFQKPYIFFQKSSRNMSSKLYI